MEKEFGKSNNILKPIEALWGTQTAYDTRFAFYRLGLPLPSKKEFGLTSDGGGLILLRMFGCTARLISRGYQIHKNDSILQPLGSLPAEELRLDINPGIETPGSLKDYDYILPALKRDRLSISDCKTDNIGYLPDAEHTRVVLDAGAVRKESGFSNARQTSGAPIQDRLFKPLTDAFTNAQNAPLSVDNPFAGFWAMCREFNEQGLLTPGWLDVPKKIKMTDQDKASFDDKVLGPDTLYHKRLLKHVSSMEIG